MTYKGVFFEREDGKRYYFTLNASDEIIAGTTILSGRKTPISSHYNGQYKATATGEVIVLQDSQIVAVLDDFDPDFTLVDAGLNPIPVVDADGNADLVYVAQGEGLMNIGTEVFEDPAGAEVYPDAEVIMGKMKITIAGGAVVAAELIEGEVPDDEVVNEITLLQVKEGETTGSVKVVAFIKGSAKLIIVVGTKVYADKTLSKPLADGIYSVKDMYFVKVSRGVVADVNKEIKDPRTK